MLAVSLARQSEKNQSQEESVSLAFQHRVNTEEAKRRNDQIACEFSDLDVSGDRKSRSKRVGLQEMLAYLKAHPDIRRVYVYNISRLARDTFFTLELVRQLRALRPPVELRSASESIEDPTILAIIASFAERERINLSNNVAYSVRENAERGLVTQPPPIGYRRETGILYPVEPHASTVRRIFREYLAGKSTYQIAEGLMADGIPSPYGKPHWRTKALRHILKCRTYIGEIEISETRDPAGKVRPYLLAKGLHEPIVSRADFDAAQTLLAKGTWIRKKDGRIEPWLSGLIYCAHCERRIYLGVKSYRPNSGDVRWYAKCATAQLSADARGPNTCSGQPSASLSLIEPVARETLRRAVSGLITPEDAYRRAQTATERLGGDRRTELQLRIKEDKTQAAVLLDLRLQRRISEETFVEKYPEIENRIARMQAELAATPVPTPLVVFQRAHDGIRDFADVIPHASNERLRELAVTINGTAYTDLGTKDVEWRFGGIYADLLG